MTEADPRLDEATRILLALLNDLLKDGDKALKYAPERDQVTIRNQMQGIRDAQARIRTLAAVEQLCKREIEWRESTVLTEEGAAKLEAYRSVLALIAASRTERLSQGSLAEMFQ